MEFALVSKRRVQRCNLTNLCQLIETDSKKLGQELNLTTD